MEYYTEVAKLLIENGAALNILLKGGYTALICACYNGHTEVVKLLIKEGADLNK